MPSAAVAGRTPLRQGRAMTRCLAFALLLSASPALAQQTEAPETGSHSSLSVSGGAFLLSDYRFRGISRSDEDPAVQGQITLSLPNGLYAGARATSLRHFAGHGDAEAD